MATYDIAALVGPPSGGELAQQLWNTAGDSLVLTGILRLAQAWTIELFTPRGSRPFAPETGSSLLLFARQGLIRTEVDAHTLFLYAAGEVDDSIKAVERETDPLDERLDTVELESVAFSPSGIVYRAALTSLAGTARTLTLPLPAIPT